MPTLREAMLKIQELKEIFGWGSDPGTKIFYGMIEMAEAGDVWKHRGDPEYIAEQTWWLKKYAPLVMGSRPASSFVEEWQVIDHMMEELIDGIFYCLDAMASLNIDVDPDEEFLKKWNENKRRGRKYLDDKRL